MARGNFGERLKRERELREVSLEEITSATRIGPRFLEALENEEWQKLPGGVFNRGFVRSVARYLGLDEESFLAEYDLAHGPAVQPSVQNNANHFSSRPKWIPFAAFLLLLALAGLLAAGGYYGWRYYMAHREEKQSLLPSVPPFGSLAKSAALFPSLRAAGDHVAGDPQSGTPLDLYVSLAEPSHLRVVADGHAIVNEDFPSGSNRHFPTRKSRRSMLAKCCWN